jgi:hypothetical protein
VETHRGHINRKLDVHSPADLLRVAATAGLLRWREPAAPEPEVHAVAARSVGA